MGLSLVLTRQMVTKPGTIQISSEKFIAARVRAGHSQGSFAEKANVSVETVKRWERFRLPSVHITNIGAIADALKMDRKVFMAEIVVNGRTLDRNMTDEIPVPAIPTWDIEVTASGWADVPLCQLDYDDPDQRRVIETGRFRLRILGTCMEPDYRDGTVVEFEIIRQDRGGVEVGDDIVVCKSDGQATFKRLAKIDEESLTLVALNQKDHPGAIVVFQQEIGRIAKVAHILSPQPSRALPKIRARKD